MDIQNITLSSQVLTVNVNETFNTPTPSVYPEDATYANVNNDFDWHCTDSSILSYGDLYFEVVSTGVVQIY